MHWQRRLFILDRLMHTLIIKLGTLEYRSVRFETELLDKPNFPGKCGSELYGS